MKKTILMFVAVAWTVAASATVGYSNYFYVDTTDGRITIADVRSNYFDGEYGGTVGRKATFMSGTFCPGMEITVVMDDDSKVDFWRWEVFDIFTKEEKYHFLTLDPRYYMSMERIPVGSRMRVVAVKQGEKDEEDIESEPFVLNFDIANYIVPLSPLGSWSTDQSTSTEIVYTPLGYDAAYINLAPEKACSFPLSKNWSWFSASKFAIMPKLNLAPKVSSAGNGSFSLGSITRYMGLKGDTNGKSIFGKVCDMEIGGTFTGGPITRSWNPVTQEWEVHSVEIGYGVYGQIEFSRPFGTFLGPMYLQFIGEVDLAAIVKIAHAGSSFRLDCQKAPKLTFALGWGLDGLASVKGALSLYSILVATASESSWESGFKWGARATGAVIAQALGFEIELIRFLDTETVWAIDTTSPKAVMLKGIEPSKAPVWRVQPRDYLKTPTGPRLLAAPPPEDGVVESGGYPLSAPAMASGAAGDALAYLRDNTARSAVNRTELVLRIGSENVWGAAEPVWDDGTADFAPSIAALTDGSIASAWMNMSRVFADEEATGPDAVSGAAEIAVGIRDARTGTWTCRNLTSDSACDLSPQVRAGTNGTAMVAWLRNASGHLCGSAAEPTDIMYSICANGVWSEPVAVVTGVGLIHGFDVAFDGDKALLAYAKDADGDQETADDAEVFAVSFNGSAWGAPIRLTYAGDSEGRPFVRGGGKTGFAVLWTQEGTLVETTELAVSNAVAVAAAKGKAISGDCSILRGSNGRDALVWDVASQSGGAAQAPTAMIYDPACGEWGAPRKLLDDGRHERHLAGAVGDDCGIRLGYESTYTATNETGEVEFGDTQLRTGFFPATCDLAVVENGFSFSPDTLVDGEETVLSVLVENLGLRSATNVTVTVYEGVGDEKEELGSVVTNFPGGGVVAVNVPWSVDNMQTDLQFTIEIDGGVNENEDAKGNDIYVWNAGIPRVAFSDVSVRNVGATKREVSATVSNTGLGPLPAGAKVVFRRGGDNGEVLDVVTIGAVRPGDPGGYDAVLVWDMASLNCTSEWETVCAQFYPDGNVGAPLDATDRAFVQVMSILDSDGDGLIDAQERSIGTDPGMVDTDGDGISDWEEINVDRTDPLKPNVALRTAPSATASDGTVTNGVLVAWNAVKHATAYEVWRSEDGSVASAERLTSVSTLSWVDESAEALKHYTYFVRARCDIGKSELGTGDEGWRPAELSIATSAIGGKTDAEFYAKLTADGGMGPYAWTWSLPPFVYDETRELSSFSEAGVRREGIDGDTSFEYTLPFEFPFYGETYTNVYVTHRGTIGFASLGLIYADITVDDFATKRGIAALWNNSINVSKFGEVTSGSGVYVDDSSADSVTFRWRGSYGRQADSTPVNFSATLRRDGTIIFSYGQGNAKGGLIGISGGKGSPMLLSAASESGSMENAEDIVFTYTLTEGLELHEGGTVTGCCTNKFWMTARVTVTDANGSVAEKDVEVFVGADLGEGAPAATATLGTDTNGVSVAWAAIDGAFWYEVWRSPDGTVANAEKVAEAKKPEWFDSTAEADVHYTYFVRAVGYDPQDETGVGKKSEFGTGAEGWRPSGVRIVTSALATRNGAACNLQLASEGGRGPYVWACKAGNSLPGGLVLHEDGTVTGTPAENAWATNRLVVTDANGTVAEKDVEIFVYTDLGEGEPTATVSGGTVADGVAVSWTAIDGAFWYEVWRSADGTAENAVKIAEVPTLSWLDETAEETIHYTYFVRAVGYNQQSALGTGAEGWRPTELRIVTSSWAGERNAAFSKQLVSEGGCAPYAWSLSPDAYNERREASTFSETGTPKGWHYNTMNMSYELPFDFPFYGKTYKTAYVGDDGTIAFSRQYYYFANNFNNFKTYPVIAALADDLKLFPDVEWDVYIDESSESVTFRWHGIYYSGGEPVNFSTTLSKDGSIRFAYGSGNAKGGIISISPGDGTNMIVSAASESGSMANADDIVLSPFLPKGLELHEDGTVTGTPVENVWFTNRVVVTDKNGTVVKKDVEIVIFSELGEGAPAAMASDGTVTNGISVSWAAFDGAFWYEVWRSVDGTAENAEIVAETKKLSWFDATADADVRYTYFVRAVGYGGRMSALGNGSVGWRPSSLTIATSSLLFTTNAVFNARLAAEGGRAPYTWSLPPNAADIVFGQRLPDGLELQADGTLRCTSTECICVTNLFAVTDSNGTVAKQDIKITVCGLDEGAVKATASLGTETNGVGIAWTEMDGASFYEVWRSLDEYVENAVKVATVNGHEWVDETAVKGVHYTYFIRAVRGDESSTFGAGTEGWVPADLGIVTSSFEGTQSTPFNDRLVAEGGRNLYSWALLRDYYAEERDTSTFSETGTAQGCQADEQYWQYVLPFEFPFYGTTYTNAYISSNGTISFDDLVSVHSMSLSILELYPMIAALWGDLTTESPGDIYVEETSDAVTFRWSGAYYPEGSPVNFSATLYADGTIKLSYGAGNRYGGMIGVSAGDGANWLVSEASQSGSMSNAEDVVFFTPDDLFGGLELHEDGTVTGTPTDTGRTTIRVVVTDASGRSVEKEIEIVILDDVIFPELGEYATAAAVKSALSVGIDKGLTNITDAAVYEAFRQWVHSVKDVDGTTAAGARTVKDSTSSWLSFALGAGKLIGKDITSSDVHIVSFDVGSAGSSSGGSESDHPVFTFKVAIDGVDIGSGPVAVETLKENLRKVLFVEGTPALSPAAFSSDDIEVTFDAPVDGKAKFSATPSTDPGRSFFLRVKVVK